MHWIKLVGEVKEPIAAFSWQIHLTITKHPQKRFLPS